MKHTISVAMTTYNGERFVEKQLTSLLNQTLKPDEVIIVDDCSIDNTVKIVNKFIKDNKLINWRLIRLSENGGFINSFNKAISNTTGEIIFLCDQDDIWLSNKIETMSKYMQSNDKILCLASGFQKIDSEDKYIISRENIFSTNNNLIRKRIKANACIKIDPEIVITYNISPGCTYAFRSVIRDWYKLLDNEEMYLVHDWKINLISSLSNGLYFLNTKTTLYRLHDSNSIGLKRNISINSRIKACKESSIERYYMENIIIKLVHCNIISDNYKIQHIYKYVGKIKDSFLEREKALKKKHIFHSIYLILKYKLFKNRMYESICIDILAILRSINLK